MILSPSLLVGEGSDSPRIVIVRRMFRDTLLFLLRGVPSTPSLTYRRPEVSVTRRMYWSPCLAYVPPWNPARPASVPSTVTFLGVMLSSRGFWGVSATLPWVASIADGGLVACSSLSSAGG